MYPVGKAQQIVLHGLGLTAESFQEAEQIFERIGIVVVSMRQGRTSVPQISERQPHGYAEDGLFDMSYADTIRQNLSEYCKPEFLATITPTQTEQQEEEKEMTLKQALAQSDIEVAELFVDGYTIVVGDDGDGGYDVGFKVEDMPPYASEHADTIDEAERIVMGFAQYAGNETKWSPRQEGDY